MDKITVKDIVETCGINRNTFYYYYKDIYDLIDDIFEIETKRVMEDKNKYDSWADELNSVVNIAMQNRKGIAHIYYSKSRDVLEKYMFTCMELIIRNYVTANIDFTGVSQENIDFVCSFFCYSLVGLTLNWIKGGMQVESEDFILKEATIFESSIKGAIESCKSDK